VTAVRIFTCRETAPLGGGTTRKGRADPPA
jgi:hypothetical protein